MNEDQYVGSEIEEIQQCTGAAFAKMLIEQLPRNVSLNERRITHCFCFTRLLHTLHEIVLSSVANIYTLLMGSYSWITLGCSGVIDLYILTCTDTIFSLPHWLFPSLHIPFSTGGNCI